VPAVATGCDEETVCAHLESVQRALARDGMLLAVGISTPARGVSELPRAYAEARGALECVAEGGGLAALPRLSPFEYLARRADPTARRLVDERLDAFLTEDRERGGVLIATIRTFAEADLNLRVTAERLQVHPNTVQYRLGRVEERTGRNPRHIADLRDMLVAIALDLS
jgi:DNA-binding PucR family transcriptional regulator